MLSEILPVGCPLCGCKGVIIYREVIKERGDGIPRESTLITCENCNLTLVVDGDSKEAAKRWCTRPEEQRLKKEVVKMRKQLSCSEIITLKGVINKIRKVI